MGIRGFGASKEGAFEQAGLALTAIIVDPKTLQDEIVIEINCDAPDDELLFVDWLNALVYEMATQNLLFGRFEVRIDRGHLFGKAWGEKVEVRRHHPAVEVKGATYTALRVLQDEDGNWSAQCVVDV